MNRDQYVALLKNLMPRGSAWPRDLSTWFHKLFEAMADEMVRYDKRIGTDLINEADPNTTLELLEDWERIVNLPDAYQTELAETTRQRQIDVLRKLTFRGGQSREFFISLAASFGYTVTIDEFRPFRSGKSRSGDHCYDIDWIHHWRVMAGSVTAQYFRSGTGRSGDRLRTWRNDTLERVIEHAAPAHTKVFFTYGG